MTTPLQMCVLSEVLTNVSRLAFLLEAFELKTWSFDKRFKEVRSIKQAIWCTVYGKTGDVTPPKCCSLHASRQFTPTHQGLFYRSNYALAFSRCQQRRGARQEGR